MLYLDGERIIENTTVFRDHENPSVYWYLPNHIAIAQRDGKPVISFLPYFIPRLNQAGAFLNFEVTLQLPSQLESTLKSKIRRAFGEWSKDARDIQLNVPQWDEGTAQCMILDRKSGGDSAGPSLVAAEGGAPKGVQFVERILGTIRPSLDGRNTAVFSVHLHKEGAEFLQAMWSQGKRDFSLGVFYSLKYTGLAPSFNAHVSADMERLYNYLGLEAEAQYKVVKAGLEVGIESAIRNQIITYETTDFKKGQENKELEKWLREFFTNKVIDDWMQPVLTPVRVADKTKKQATSLYDDEDEDSQLTGSSKKPATGASPGATGDGEQDDLDEFIKNLENE